MSAAAQQGFKIPQNWSGSILKTKPSYYSKNSFYLFLWFIDARGCYRHLLHQADKTTYANDSIRITLENGGGDVAVDVIDVRVPRTAAKWASSSCWWRWSHRRIASTTALVTVASRGRFRKERLGHFRIREKRQGKGNKSHAPYELGAFVLQYQKAL
jgi:hypothetical protein